MGRAGRSDPTGDRRGSPNDRGPWPNWRRGSRSAARRCRLRLRVLKDAGLVTERAAGTRRIYRLNPPPWPRCATTGTPSGAGPSPTAGKLVEQPTGRRATGTAGVGMTQEPTAVVRKEIVVDASIEKAFAVFTGRLGDIKPRGAQPASRRRSPRTVFEPRVGGHIVRPRHGWNGVPLGPGAGLRAAAEWCSAGTSARPGRWRPSRRRRARSRCDSSRGARPHPRGARAPEHRPSRSRLGGRRPRRRARRRAGRCTSPGTPRCSARPRRCRRSRSPPRSTGRLRTSPPAPANPTRFGEWRPGVLSGHLDSAARRGGRGFPVRHRAPDRWRGEGGRHRSWSVWTRRGRGRVRGVDGPIRAAVDVTVEPLRPAGRRWRSPWTSPATA